MLGEAGIGKSALLYWSEEQARSRGLEVVRAKTQEIERERPFGLLRELLAAAPEGPEIAAIRALLTASTEGPGLGWIDNSETRFRAVDLFVGAFERLASVQPTLLLVDDLQWADDFSLIALNALLRRAADHPIVTIMTLRPEQPGVHRRALLEAIPPSHRLELGPLSDAEVGLVAGEVLGQEPSQALLERVARADGNPLYAIALAETWEVEADTAENVPASLRVTVMGQVERLDQGTQSVLRVAAIVGRPISVDVLAGLVGESLVVVVERVEAAVSARLLSDSEGQVAFRHDLVRECVLDAVPTAIRAALHMLVGRGLFARHWSAVDVVAHFQAGATSGDLDAVAVLRSAARELSRFAPSAARAMLERSVEILPEEHPDRLETLAELAEACVFAADPERGMELTDDLLARVPPPGIELSLRNARSQVFFLRGAAPDAAEEFERMAPLVAGLPREAVLLADAAISSMFAIDLERAETLAAQCLEVAVDTDDRVGPVLAKGVQSWLRALRGDLGTGLRLAEDAVRLADGGRGLDGHRRIPHLFHAQALLWADQTDAAAASLGRGRLLSNELGMGWDEPMYHALAADLRVRSGEWDDAMVEVEAGLERGEEVGSHFADGWLHSHQARVLLGRGDLDLADASLRAGEESVARGGGQGADQLWWTRALWLAARGNEVASLKSLRMLWGALDGLETRLRQAELAPDLVRLAMSLSDESLVESVLDALSKEPISRTLVGQSSIAWCHGLGHGDADELRRATELLDARDVPVDAARCRYDLVAILPSGDEADRLGLEAAAVLTGLRDPEAANPDESAGPWGDLTRSERRVVEMVAAGRSNAGIADELSVSRRTVESHLYHAYPKLGVSNRVELALLVADRAE